MKKKTRVGLLALTALLIFGIADSSVAGAVKAKSTLRMKSTSFKDGGMIPDNFTCKGKNISPELNWKAPPINTKYFAIICEDPDAQGLPFIHWVIYNIPAKMDSEKNVFELLEGFPKVEKTPQGIFQGVNDFGKIGYDGPCPPSGLHLYFFKLYALDSPVALGGGASKAKLLRAMEKHILGWTQIMGKYGN